ncbi:MAG: anthranilate synthase component I [Acidobacteriota bacterium]|nr:anthranilate synthase component I [Acidobacteriota bacterium]
MKLIPVCKEIGVDLETPVSVFLKLQRIGAKFLLESVEKGEKLGRYSFIGLNPSSILEIKEDEFLLDGKTVSFQKNDFLEKLREIIFPFKLTTDQELPSFAGGWVGYLGYDVIRFFEILPSKLPSDLDIPMGILCLIKDILVFDHLKHKVKVIILTSSKEENQKAVKKIERIVQAINTPMDLKKRTEEKSSVMKKPQSNFKKKEFEKIVERAKEYILDGDVFQVVLSQRFSGETSAMPFKIYRKLRMINPSPYMFFLDFKDFKLIGSSPEALVKLNKDVAYLHPIAGTRSRGRTLQEDNQLAEELFQSEKEIAEHVMLVDLARNDLGKVCLPHSIKVIEKMNLEKYSHVMHLVSEVRGLLDRKFDAIDLFKATFPAGTVTGAPKIRAMEIIEELEKTKRGPYSGAVGYFGLDGNIDMCIAIRMIIYQKGKYYLQAGAGIVADSIPSSEYRETLNKMEGLYQAIKMSEENEDDFANRQL